ncbi:MAG: MlaD family protein [Verrucomicrobiia bacterium]|jgi:phospholipid/cholesterol/gamma-HCH transport system substrate-binding protein
MNKSKQEWKVGVFMLISLVVMAALMIGFSKGFSFFASTYELNLRSGNIAGLKREAAVHMAGVQIGQVGAMNLAPDGKSVIVTLLIEDKYKIHGDARFSIEQAGFLGDQYIAISPQTNGLPVLAPGAEVQCDEPFNLQEAGKLAQGLIEKVDMTVATLNNALERVDKTLLAENTLTNLATTIANFRQISESTVETMANFRKISTGALTTVDTLQRLIEKNSPGIDGAVSNVVQFTEQLGSVTNLSEFSHNLTELSTELRATVSSNRLALERTMDNLERSSAATKSLLEELNAGRGAMGSLLKDEQLKLRMTLVFSNMTILSSNLNRFGLLYKPKRQRSPRTNDVRYPGRSPFRK